MSQIPIPIIIPTPEEIFTKIPLYKSLDTSKTCVEELVSVLYYSGRIDIFCPSCKKESTFISNTKNLTKEVIFNVQSSPMRPSDENEVVYDYLVKIRYFQVKFGCSRNSDHTIIFVFSLIEDKLTKIGQFPSIADLSAADTKKYTKALSKEKHKEFSKSIGLFAHGVGIGSFVYLRRIFEDLIEEAHTQAKASPLWDEDNYQKQNSVVNKIVLLKDFLPNFLVKNKTMYGILSKGIHELSEEECLEYFPIMKLGIELILDEKLEKIESQKKIEEATKTIALIHQNLASGK
jgi:hypothetical protein